MYQEMTIFGFTLDSVSRRPVVLLKSLDGSTTVPLWITVTEGVSIAADLISRDLAGQEGRTDFLTLFMKRLGMRISRVTVDHLESSSIAAAVWVEDATTQIRIDVSLSEALNVVLTYKASLMISDELAEWATRYALHDEAVVSESNERRYADFLENLDPSQMGKYPM